jgi:hypothetical protein
MFEHQRRNVAVRHVALEVESHHFVPDELADYGIGK